MLSLNAIKFYPRNYQKKKPKT